MYVPEMQLVKSVNLTGPITNLDMIKSFLLVILMVCCAKQKELPVDLHVSTVMKEFYYAYPTALVSSPGIQFHSFESFVC